MTTATQPNPREGVLILDQLDMLVTNEPIAELDAALATVTTHLHLARERGDSGPCAHDVPLLADRTSCTDC